MKARTPGSKRTPISAQATLRRAGRAVNSVFGRLALLAVALLLLIQATWMIVVAQYQNEVQADHVSRLVRLASGTGSIADGKPPMSLRTQLSDTLGIRVIDADTLPPPVGLPECLHGYRWTVRSGYSHAFTPA